MKTAESAMEPTDRGGKQAEEEERCTGDKTSCFDVSGVPFSLRGYTTSNTAKTRTAVEEKKQTAEMRDENKTVEKTAADCGNWLFHNVTAASLLKRCEEGPRSSQQTACVCVCVCVGGGGCVTLSHYHLSKYSICETGQESVQL